MKQQLAVERAAKERRRSSIRSDNARRSRIHAGARRGDTAEEQKQLQKQLAFGASKSGKLSSSVLLNTTRNVPTRTHNFMTTNMNIFRLRTLEHHALSLHQMTMLRMSILPRISSWKEMDDEEDKLVETEEGPKSSEAVAVRRLTLMRTTLLPHLASWSAVAAEEAVCIRFLLILP